jgi:hypothetical protein
MFEANSIPAAHTSKPSKPYPEYPLFAAAATVCAQKIGGKLHCFAPWSDLAGELSRYLAEKDALHAARKPRPETD